MLPKINRLPGSFRDPSGYIFTKGENIYRRINRQYFPHYRKLMQSGLYDELVSQGLLIPHREVGMHQDYIIIKPESIPFISYPYEWCFSQLKDAALTMLAIQKKALNLGLVLKDASSFNIQFMGGKPLLIDTLSFENYLEGQIWIGYRQFCQHFLAPLSLMVYKDLRLNQLSKIFLDGIPLTLTAGLLPVNSWLKTGISAHLHFQAIVEKNFFTSKTEKKFNLSKSALLRLVDNLEGTVNSLRLKKDKSIWSSYYSDTNYSGKAMTDKKRIITSFLKLNRSKTVWDLGANTGLFSRIAAKHSSLVLSMDNDPMTVELNYEQLKTNHEKRILPLVVDLTNPSPSLGWENKERSSLSKRGPADTAMALALVHHLTIGNNLPLEMTAEYFSHICRFLIIEFVPKEDSQIVKMLSSREDIFSGYNETSFHKSYGRYFNLLDKRKVCGSLRSIYLLKNKR